MRQSAIKRLGKSAMRARTGAPVSDASAEAEFKQFYTALGRDRRTRLMQLIEREFAYRKLPVPPNALHRVAQAYAAMMVMASDPLAESRQIARFEGCFGVSPRDIIDPAVRKLLLSESPRFWGHLVAYAVRLYMADPANPRLTENYLKVFGATLAYFYRAAGPTEKVMLRVTSAGQLCRIIQQSEALTAIFDQLIRVEYKLSGVSLIEHRLTADELYWEAQYASQCVAEKLVERLVELIDAVAADMLKNPGRQNMGQVYQAVRAGLVELATPVPQAVFDAEGARRKIEQGKQRLLAVVMETMFEASRPLA